MTLDNGASSDHSHDFRFLEDLWSQLFCEKDSDDNRKFNNFPDLSRGFFSIHVPSRTAYIYQPNYQTHRFSCITLATVATAGAPSLLYEHSAVSAYRYVHIRTIWWLGGIQSPSSTP